MEPPALVGSGGEAAREQVLFVFAQPWHAADFSEYSRDFFFHKSKTRLPAVTRPEDWLLRRPTTIDKDVGSSNKAGLFATKINC